MPVIFLNIIIHLLKSSIEIFSLNSSNMSKISSVLLICLFVCGMMCIQQQNKQYGEK